MNTHPGWAPSNEERLRILHRAFDGDVNQRVEAVGEMVDLSYNGNDQVCAAMWEDGAGRSVLLDAAKAKFHERSMRAIR